MTDVDRPQPTTAQPTTARNEPHRFEFRCNVCQRRNAVSTASLGRDVPSCRRCGSSVRTRSIIHALSMELFGRCLAIGEFPKRPGCNGMGLSDLKHYASRLKRRLRYVNSFYHCRPRLDITDIDPSRAGSLDFLIASDVFEHVRPPVRDAFDNSFRMLRPGGVFIFSVPYGNAGETREHFPELHEYRLEKRSGKSVLINRTRDGESEVFEDLVFHGGKGAVLEMRVFSRAHLIRLFAAAGFETPRIYGDDHPDCGMLLEHPWSLTMAARVPR